MSDDGKYPASEFRLKKADQTEDKYWTKVSKLANIVNAYHFFDKIMYVLTRFLFSSFGMNFLM